MSGFEREVLNYLLNALWEVPVIFAGAWLMTFLLRQIGSLLRLEHRVWVGALLLQAILPACHLDLGSDPAWFALVARQVGRMLWGGDAGAGETRVVLGAGVIGQHGVLHLPQVMLLVIVGAYGCSLVYFGCRLGWGLRQTDLMGRRAERVTLKGEAGRCFARCGKTLGVDGVVVAISAALPGPVTVGIFRRMLLVPPRFLEEVAPGDLEALVAHEFAHMRRQDFLKNLLYGLLTLPVSFHPVLWLTRARLAESREMVCDGMAAAAVAGKEQYARSLLRLASLLADRAGQMAFAGKAGARTLHAIGIFDANIFERRVMNLTERRVAIKGVRRVGMAVACVVVGLATCASALTLRMEAGGPVAASEKDSAKTTQGTARVSGGVMAGQVVTKVDPVYPQDAKDAKITGTVVLAAVIGKDGTIQNLQAVSGPEKLRRSALDAVRQWTYKPYLLNGNATEVETTIQVTYSLAP